MGGRVSVLPGAALTAMGLAIGITGEQVLPLEQRGMCRSWGKQTMPCNDCSPPFCTRTLWSSGTCSRTLRAGTLQQDGAGSTLHRKAELLYHTHRC